MSPEHGTSCFCQWKQSSLFSHSKVSVAPDAHKHLCSSTFCSKPLISKPFCYITPRVINLCRNTDKIAKAFLSWQQSHIFVSINQNYSLNVAALPKNNTILHTKLHYTRNLCMETAALSKDETLSFIHPKSCSHAGTFPSFDKTSIIRIVNIVKLVFFLHSVCTKALLGEIIFSFLSGNHRGFQPHAGEKKKQIMGIFSEPCCLTHHLLGTRDWKEQEFPQSKWQFSPAANNLFFSPSPDIVEEEQKKRCTWKRKIKTCFSWRHKN